VILSLLPKPQRLIDAKRFFNDITHVLKKADLLSLNKIENLHKAIVVDSWKQADQCLGVIVSWLKTMPDDGLNKFIELSAACIEGNEAGVSLGPEGINLSKHDPKWELGHAKGSFMAYCWQCAKLEKAYRQKKRNWLEEFSSKAQPSTWKLPQNDGELEKKILDLSKWHQEASDLHCQAIVLDPLKHAWNKYMECWVANAMNSSPKHSKHHLIFIRSIMEKYPTCFSLIWETPLGDFLVQKNIELVNAYLKQTITGKFPDTIPPDFPDTLS
jgi:hypothetical protein